MKKLVKILIVTLLAINVLTISAYAAYKNFLLRSDSNISLSIEQEETEIIHSRVKYHPIDKNASVHMGGFDIRDNSYETIDASNAFSINGELYLGYIIEIPISLNPSEEMEEGIFYRIKIKHIEATKNTRIYTTSPQQENTVTEITSDHLLNAITNDNDTLYHDGFPFLIPQELILESEFPLRFIILKKVENEIGEITVSVSFDLKAYKTDENPYG